MRSLLYRAFALVLALVFVLSTVACSSSWVSQALDIIAALTPAVTNIVPLIALADKNFNPQSAAQIQSYSTQASNALKEVAALIDAYNQAVAAKQPTADLLAKIDVALGLADQQLSQILPLLHIYDPKRQTEVQAAVSAAIAEVGSLEALLPVLKAGRYAQAVKMAKSLSAQAFRDRYNRAIRPIPGSKALQLHSRSFFGRLGHDIAGAF